MVKSVICTQPRRVAAIEAANRVAKEMNYLIGSEVGYKIQYENFTSNKTKIKFLTNGMFLREIFEINSWNSYKCFIIDEIHERTLEIDLILGLLKSIQKVSIGMKIILMSATISVNKLLDFFCNSVYLRIEGRIMSVCIKVKIIIN